MFTISLATGTPALSAPVAEVALQLVPVVQFPVTTLFFQNLLAAVATVAGAKYVTIATTLLKAIAARF
jgi:hypothetical protein